MARRSRYTEYNEDLNVWPAFTDLMSNAFMILVLFLFLTIIISQITKDPGSTDTPPIIIIKDQGDYRFASGSAEIPAKMSTYIFNQIVPEIEARTKQYGINVVEIIGHTDGQANSKVTSNLDVNLENVASGNLQVGKLQAGSNADLGLMRALSVVKVLGDIQKKQGKLSGLSFRAYSAAQLILPNGKFAGIARKEDVTRRRIEIRFTRLGEVQEVR
ncbi:MAG: flagellar motor protein [Dolichospermum sp. JUN01]|jgi:outer membrane protein OmpA-like peptidoglycan-associated protein|nr:flagellar motor protein [Dolichospermum sp. JUN01]MBS9392048.1 flagellar motor protein [Dolichospermum sp. OL01]MCO5795692.1 flagellar motor protein [Dolichospermum sp. OL03]MCS6280553.1 flagellar motor protein [Dolichospermum sp.]QSV57374.1 MAG: flagellar motor protein [Dolichospermum sp. LBC05a]QSV63050.1 MAG: flagellar motor protein [Dolichospermum sp. DL01]